MHTLKRNQYDAVFNSHNLEHVYQYQVPLVLAGFQHVLKPNGFAHIAVPDMAALCEAIVSGHRDLNDTWYVSSGGPITFHDVMYGWGAQVSKGNHYYAHKTGFTEKMLTKVLLAARFTHVYMARDNGNLTAFAFKATPTLTQRRETGI
jgi:ubiquinone/menaquinone biosynthesis C-methylase UbiE